MGSSSELASRAEVLGNMVNGAPEHLPEVLPELLAMLDLDQPVEVMVAAIEALGHAWTESACLAVIPFANHPDESVRLAAVRSMPGGVTSKAGSMRVATALIDRLRDDDLEIRDWATFGLSSILDVDSVEIRDALRINLEDPDYDVQCEALIGLARRGDPSALEATIRLLTGESVGRLAVESAGLLADPRLLPALSDLSAWWDVDPDLLDASQMACRGAVVNDYRFQDQYRPLPSDE
jgi:HEAT repeat protein